MGISEFGSSDVAADAPASLGGTAKFRAKIEGCFGGCGRLFGQNSLLRSITLVILIILTTVTSAGLKHYYLEGDTQILWTEIGGRLSVSICLWTGVHSTHFTWIIVHIYSSTFFLHFLHPKGGKRLGLGMGHWRYWANPHCRPRMRCMCWGC